MNQGATAELNPLHGAIGREAYIHNMREVAIFVGRVELAQAPELVQHGWTRTDVETDRHFDHLTGGSRAEVSAVTLNRIHGILDTSTDDSAETARKALRGTSGTGDNYQFSTALDKAEGNLKLELLDTLVENELMNGFPEYTVKWIDRAGGNAIGTEARGYDLPFFDEVWELAQHPDVGLKNRADLAKTFAKDKGKIISPETWQTEQGQAARVVWQERHEAVQEQIDTVYIEQAEALCADPSAAPEDHTIHALANDIEWHLTDRWRRHANVLGQEASFERVRDLVTANVNLRVADAQVQLERAEATNASEGPDINVSNVSLWRLKELLGMVKEERYDNVADTITPIALEGETLETYRQQATDLEQRLKALKGSSVPEAVVARTKSVARRALSSILRRN